MIKTIRTFSFFAFWLTTSIFCMENNSPNITRIKQQFHEGLLAKPQRIKRQRIKQSQRWVKSQDTTWMKVDHEEFVNIDDRIILPRRLSNKNLRAQTHKLKKQVKHYIMHHYHKNYTKYSLLFDVSTNLAGVKERCKNLQHNSTLRKDQQRFFKSLTQSVLQDFNQNREWEKLPHCKKALHNRNLNQAKQIKDEAFYNLYDAIIEILKMLIHS